MRSLKAHESCINDKKPSALSFRNAWLKWYYLSACFILTNQKVGKLPLRGFCMLNFKCNLLATKLECSWNDSMFSKPITQEAIFDTHLEIHKKLSFSKFNPLFNSILLKVNSMLSYKDYSRSKQTNISEIQKKNNF